MENDKIEKLLNKIGGDQVPSDVEKIAGEEFESFNRKLKNRGVINFREFFMRTKFMKITVAAVVVLAVILGIPFFRGTGPSVTLAAVYEKMMLVDAFMYKMKMKTTTKMHPDMPAVNGDAETTVTISTEFGIKEDMNMVMGEIGQKMRQIMYILPQENKAVTIMPEQKQYLVMEYNDELFAKAKKESNDPRDMVKQVLNCKYTELGKSTINGIEVEGFQTTDPAYIGGALGDVKITLWVDRNTELPVRAELYFKMGEQLQMEGVIEDFQWDLKVESTEFEPVIPQDYTTAFPDGFKMPLMNEETAIEGLRASVERTGEYPEKLDMTVMFRGITPDVEDMNKPSKEAFAQKMVEKMRPMMSLFGFYAGLVRDKKDPAYYGDVVGPNDSDMVLMRWKTGENEYRVIYGDLTAETVSVEKVAELESRIPK